MAAKEVAVPPATRRAISTGLPWKRPEKRNNRVKYKTTRRVWTLRVVFCFGDGASGLPPGGLHAAGDAVLCPTEPGIGYLAVLEFDLGIEPVAHTAAGIAEQNALSSDSAGRWVCP